MKALKIENGIVVSVRYEVNEVFDGEILSEVGELGQRMLEDGTFEDLPVEQIAPEPTIEERILFETEYQTMLLESVAIGGM